MISDKYFAKVSRMLGKMPDGAVVRIDRVCVPENRVRFIQAIRKWIASQPVGCRVRFSSDGQKFMMTVKPIKSFRDQWKSPDAGQSVDPVVIKSALNICKWHENRIKDPIQPFTLKGCEKFNDPVFTIIGFIKIVNAAKPSSKQFGAYVHKLEKMRDLINEMDARNG
tara:strand:+ start:8383 stop:8883 length:501 start_codon:yes stop_codon:yes gene_type:complete